MICVFSPSNVKEYEKRLAPGAEGDIKLVTLAAEKLFSVCSDRESFAVICGVGNNGADGYALAKILRANGKSVDIFSAGEPQTPACVHFAQCCAEAGISVYDAFSVKTLRKYKTVVDCIFGYGFSASRPLDAKYRKLFDKINSSGAYVVSADIPSGISAENGLGEYCVTPDVVAVMGLYKTGHFLGRSKDVIKKTVLCDLGFSPEKNFETVNVIEKKDAASFIKGLKRAENSHKGTYGTVSILAGSKSYSGAAKLANISLSALRMGCGISRLCVPDAISDSVMPYILESTLLPLPSTRSGKVRYSEEAFSEVTKNASVVVVGMGWGTPNADYAAFLKNLLTRYDGTLVIDADGLNTISAYYDELMPCVRKRTCSVIMTPHPRELERLKKTFEERSVIFEPDTSLGICHFEYNGDSDLPLVILLKGTGTLVFDGKETYLSTAGTNGMATAGSGDVLSGLVAGISAWNKCRPSAKSVALTAYVAGLAAELASADIPPMCHIASDTVKYIPLAVKTLSEQ